MHNFEIVIDLMSFAFSCIQSVFGIAQSELVLSIIMIVLLLMVLIYTTLGGMISVIITDYIKFVVLSIGMIQNSVKLIFWMKIFFWVDNTHKN